MKRNVAKNGCLLLLGIVFAVWLIKNTGVQLYRIPANQMEETLLEGDNLLVNKWSYGLRLPQTLLALPFLHDSIPGTKLKSYFAFPQIPYLRLFPKEAKRNDIVVFNRPDAPTRKIPTDRRKIAVGRCIGVPGDTVCMSNGHLFINGKEAILPPQTYDAYLTPDSLEAQLCSILIQARIPDTGFERIPDYRIRFFPRYRAEEIRRIAQRADLLQPIHLKQNNYTIILPRPHEPVNITPENIHLLYPLLVRHENLPVTRTGNRLLLDGKTVKSVRLSQPYYWIAGDHRAKAADSRIFGAVPHSHLIGKGVAVGYSIDPRKPLSGPLRTDRLFKPID
ncbi:MAG: signal peptidase I [Coprobacter sp.]|nr:signal peptidase I [Coprobacter sp.]